MKEIPREPSLRAVLVGCGAIARTQAAAFVAEGVIFQALVDPVRARADSLARTLGDNASVSTELSPGLVAGARIAVVCSPPWEHARQCTELLEAGVDVLCEKPLALSATDVTSLLAASERQDRVLGVAMVRRFMGQSESLKEIVSGGILGAPRSVRVRESMFGWPLSKGMLDPSGTPVGTLSDSGTHVLDLLQWVFGPLSLGSYSDNAEIGEESFCRLSGKSGDTDFELFLMRRVAVAPRWTVEFERGRVVFSPRNTGQLDVHVPGLNRPLVADRSQDHFRLQARNFLAAVRGEAPLRNSLRDCAAMTSLIDDCHRSRRPRARRVFREEPGAKTLVTGGTGNIGSRLAEILVDRGELARYKFLVRNFDNAADLCRLGATIELGDLSRGEGLNASLSGCTRVLHLGAGTDPGRETRNLALAARRSGIERFVHFSTANVFGMDLDPALEELQDATALHETGDTYCDGKAEAERELARFKDLNPIVLRPHIVYGPGMRWTYDLANQLESGRLAVLDPSGWANLIYVDDLVECALAMLQRSERGAYFITDTEPLLWNRFIDTHADRLGYRPPPRCKRPSSEEKGLWNQLAASGRALRRVLASESFKDFVTKDPLAKATLFRFYLRTRDTGMMKKAKSRLDEARSTEVGAEASAQWLTLQTSQARLSTSRLQSATGFKPTWSFERGAEVSVEWLRARGY